MPAYEVGYTTGREQVLCCTLVRLGSVPPADPSPNTSSLQAGDTLLGLSLELLKQSTPASILKTGPYFFRVGPPVKSQAPSFKLDRVQALGYYKIMKGKKLC